MGNVFKFIGIVASIVAIYEVGRIRGEKSAMEIAKEIYTEGKKG